MAVVAEKRIRDSSRTCSKGFWGRLRPTARAFIVFQYILWLLRDSECVK